MLVVGISRSQVQGPPPMAKQQKRFDASMKYLLELFPRAGPALLGLRTRRVSVLNADLATVTTLADKVFRIHDPEPWILHVEFLSSHRYRLPPSLAAYNTLLDNRHALPVWSVVVLLRSEADRPELTGAYQRLRPDGSCYLDFRYTVVRVWQQPFDAFLSGELGLLPLASLAEGAGEVLPYIIDRIKARVTEEAAPAVGRELLATSRILMGLHYEEAFVEQLFSRVSELEESTVYQAILRKGEAKGQAQGRAEGAQKILLRLGRKRFGPPDKPTRAALEAITDLDRLEQLSERLLEVASWQELLALPRTRSKGRRRTSEE
jgi:predicted transposase YdaD